MDISRDEIRAAVAAQLGSAVTEIADTDDLIQMGLNSMRMMSLAGGWRKRGSGITFADLAGSPTIERWHALLGGGEIASPATPDDRPPSQSRPWKQRRSRLPPCNTRTGSVAPTNRN